MKADRVRSLPIVVGAGPVGLAAALFLARAGVKTRVIERNPARTVNSKALIVNPRTLGLLDSVGVAPRLRELGMPYLGGTVWAGDHRLAEIDFGILSPPGKPPDFLGLSQAQTERVLEDSLNEVGVTVERGVSVEHCENIAGGVRVLIRPVGDLNSQAQSVDAPWLLAADGAHSTIRKAMQLDFPGDSMDRQWQLCDVRIRTDLDPQRVHIFQVSGGGFLFVARVVVDHRQETDGPQLWRVLGDMPDPLAHVPFSQPIGEPVWVSQFHIAHRLVEQFNVGAVYLAGDAAHIHSPLGGRGMNLGIEDAWVFAECLKRGELGLYHDRRWSADHRVVRKVRLLTRMLVGEAGWSRVARRLAVPVGVRLDPVRRFFVKTLSGLDHPLPF